MKPAPFEYEDPETVEEALALLATYGDECKVLAGGQSLVPLMNFRLARPSRLIDLNRVGSLSHIEASGGRLVIGAMTRHSQLEYSAEAAASCPLLTQAVAWVGHAQIRNRGTVGGSAAHADPAAELPAAFAALDATFNARSRRGDRAIGWKDFFRSEFTTALEADELLVSIEVPIPAPGTGTAFVEFARRHGDFALGGAAVAVQVDEAGRCSHAAIALLAAGSAPVRAIAAEEELQGVAVDGAAIGAAAAAAVKGLHPTGDIHGSAEYRIGLLQVMTERALTQAVARVRRAN
jgi:CO/xanthine dehydrogenase FAD-binding subunit